MHFVFIFSQICIILERISNSTRLRSNIFKVSQNVLCDSRWKFLLSHIVKEFDKSVKLAKLAAKINPVLTFFTSL